MQLPPELDFLSSLLIAPSEEYRSAIWLLSKFGDNTWKYSFNFKDAKELNWNIQLHDGSSLTAQKNENLLNGFKYYLTCSTRNHAERTESNNLQYVQRGKFMKACHIIDHLLINGERYQLGTYGLEGLTGGNLVEILENLAKSSLISESIYNWEQNLRDFCLELVKQSSIASMTKTILSIPQLSTITQEQIENDSLGILHDIIPWARAALYLNNLYHKQVDGNIINTTAISQLIYPGTIWGINKPKPSCSILNYNDDCSQIDREYPAAPITSGVRDRLKDTTFTQYRRAIYNLGILHEIPLPAPSLEALDQAENYRPNLTSVGRHRTLHSEIVFSALRKSIEFHLEHGQELIKAFCRVALECKKRKISPAALTAEEVQTLVGPKLRAFGITRLSMAMRSTGAAKARSRLKGQKIDYFINLRNNRCLYELLAVYMGSIQFTLGILIGRRASELQSLNPRDCLDETEKWLVFANAKSTRNLFGIRRLEARPIEPLAVDMIKTLIRMQKTLVRIGYTKNLKTLFAMPNFLGTNTLIESSTHTFNRNLDFFCDYFETPLNDNGERYYFRQHQLRRFFAMLFFYSGSFAKLDTLQWMMGHNDPSHVYRYITESTDGAILTGAKANFAAERLRDGDEENFQELRQLLKDRYGSDDYTIIDTHDLEDQIQELIEEGWIEIEPDFFTDHQDTNFKVVARLKRRPEAA
ncbi:integrase [Pseudomonas sp. BGr12]|uniref:integrase n=1 Tax=Pseudomonas sp. BGr12 TaxID=2936269 RepID=UPI002559DDDC|nr:integrase [Pseudomonas sp. BJa5]MDL2426276.1 integrase [Pseudomonas sp. BJa5]